MQYNTTWKGMFPAKNSTSEVQVEIILFGLQTELYNVYLCIHSWTMERLMHRPRFSQKISDQCVCVGYHVLYK